MKKVNKLPIILIITLTVLLAVSVYGFTASKPAKAYTDPSYRFELAGYAVEYDIAENCEISVTEDITVNYRGIRSTGFIRDIPVNGGVQVRDVKVVKIFSDGNTFSDGFTEVPYDVYYEYDDFLSVDIGDTTNKYGKSESYRLTYTYIITNSVVKKSMLPLNPIGYGWYCDIYNASVKLILPDGFTGAECYSGPVGTSIAYPFNTSVENGRTVITANADKLNEQTGITFDLHFVNGAIKNYTDFTPYFFALAGLAVIFIIVILKLFVFNKNAVMPVVNYEAPDRMDPLIMGKLIDNKVDGSDVTSLIFYWASKGYIKINLDNKSDPVIIRIMASLPEPCKPYERVMYDSLFKNGDMVRISQLKNKFYKTVEKVTAMVNSEAKGLYDQKSFAVSFTFAVLGGLLAALTPIILAFVRISSKLLMFAPLICILPAVVVYAFMTGAVYTKYKTSKKQTVFFFAGMAFISAIFTLAYALFIPSSVIAVGPKVAVSLTACIISAMSALLVMRTKAYTDKLNDILGFKNFIELAEKDQLEMMIEQDPQFYYHILPYAQVLGVSKLWENKFAALTVEPPQWLSGNMVSTYIEFRIINSLINGSLAQMNYEMSSRPSSSGANGGGRGGFGGGFSGGGFGGGGGRGR